MEDAFQPTCRKRLLLQEQLNAADELRLSAVLLRRRPKSPDNFFHRQWLVQRLLDQAPPVPPEERTRLLEAEIQLCLEAADRYPRNYYAWTYRSWLLEQLPPERRAETHLRRELQRLHSWMELHVSDYSAYHHLQRLLQRLFACLADQPDRVELLLEEELAFVQQLHSLYPAQESLFLHRRFLLKQALDSLPAKREQWRLAEESTLNQLLQTAGKKENQWLRWLVDRQTSWLKKVAKLDVKLKA